MRSMVIARPLRLSSDEQERIRSKQRKELRIARVLQVRNLAKQAATLRLQQYRQRLCSSQSLAQTRLLQEWHQKQHKRCKSLAEKLQKDEDNLGKGHEHAGTATRKQKEERLKARKLQQAFCTATSKRVKAVVAVEKRERDEKGKIESDILSKRKEEMVVSKERAHSYGKKIAAADARKKKEDAEAEKAAGSRARRGCYKLVDFKNTRLHQLRSLAAVQLHGDESGGGDLAGSRAREEEQRMLEDRARQMEQAARDNVRAKDRCKAALERERNLRERERIEQVMELMMQEKRKTRLAALTQGDLTDAPLLRSWERKGMERKLQSKFEKLFIDSKVGSCQPEETNVIWRYSDGNKQNVRALQLSPVPEGVSEVESEVDLDEVDSPGEICTASRTVVLHGEERAAVLSNVDEVKEVHDANSGTILQGDQVCTPSSEQQKREIEDPTAVAHKPTNLEQLNCKDEDVGLTARSSGTLSMRQLPWQPLASYDEYLDKVMSSSSSFSDMPNGSTGLDGIDNSAQAWLRRYLEDDLDSNKSISHMHLPCDDKDEAGIIQEEAQSSTHAEFNKKQGPACGRNKSPNQKAKTELKTTSVASDDVHLDDNGAPCEKQLAASSKYKSDVVRSMSFDALFSRGDESMLPIKDTYEVESQTSESSCIDQSAGILKSATLSPGLDVGPYGKECSKSDIASTMSLEIEHLLSSLIQNNEANSSIMSEDTSLPKMGMIEDSSSTSDTLSLPESILGPELKNSSIVRSGLGLHGYNLGMPQYTTMKSEITLDSISGETNGRSQDSHDRKFFVASPHTQKSRVKKLVRISDSPQSNTQWSQKLISSCERSFWKTTVSGASSLESLDNHHEGWEVALSSWLFAQLSHDQQKVDLNTSQQITGG